MCFVLKISVDSKELYVVLEGLERITIRNYGSVTVRKADSLSLIREQIRSNLGTNFFEETGCSEIHCKLNYLKRNFRICEERKSH